MKKIVSIISLIFIIGIGSVSAQCGACCSNKKSNITKSNLTDKQTSQEVKAYYFHATRRCATCKAVESVTKNAIQKYFKEKVVFQSINRDQKENKSLLKKYNINGQALIIVKGKKIVNLTNSAFLNARNNPKKLEDKIKRTIHSML